MYTVDNDDYLPVGCYDANGDGDVLDSEDYSADEASLILYAGSKAEVFECPWFSRDNYAGTYGKRTLTVNGQDFTAWRCYMLNNFRHYNTPEGADGRWKNGLFKQNYSFKISGVASDTILSGDYNRGFSYAKFGDIGYWDRRGISFGHHANMGCNLNFVDGHVEYFARGKGMSDELKTGSTYGIDSGGYAIGIYAANMAPSGTYWTVIKD